MENASKALIMAAGVLIGVLIISLAVYLFADFGSTSAEINRQNEQQKIVQFNSQFTSYIGKELTIYDVVTILGYAQENNIYYEDSTNDKITVKLRTNDITLYNENRKKELIQNDQTNIINGKLPIYYLTEDNIEYNNVGKVKSITFTSQP